MKFADVKVGVIVILQEKYPCKLVEVNWSHPGKHGGSKKTVVGLDILTDKKYTDVFHSSSIIEEPIITREVYQVLWIDDEGYAHLQDRSGTIREDINIQRYDPDIIKNLKKYEQVLYVLYLTLMTVIVKEETGYKIMNLDIR